LKETWSLTGRGWNYVHVACVILGFKIHFIIMSFFLFLDRIFFPGFQRINVKKPVFIIGHPRSGTTFIHHLFNQTGETASFKAWHLLFPSLTARILVRPVIQFMIRRNHTNLIPKETGHHIALDKPEEEEMLFIHNLDTQFLTAITPLGFLDDDFSSLRFHDLQPENMRIKSAEFLKSCFQRQIYATGNPQIFAQTHYSTHRIKTLLDVFPDAKFIYIDRAPEETLPSYFSLIYNVMDLIWGMHRFSPNDINRFFQNRYTDSLDLYRYFHDLQIKGEIDETRVLIIPYDQLRDDLNGVFERITSFTGLEPSLELRAAVTKQAEKQKHYRREHAVRSISEFGIDESRIQNDFAFCRTPS
jgi:hypothetical protein